MNDTLFQFLRHRYRKFGEISRSLRNEDQNYMYVWFALLMTRIWGTVRFIIYWINQKYIEDNGNPNDNLKDADNVLEYFQAAGDPSQAFCNCLLFCVFDKKVRQHIVTFIKLRCTEDKISHKDIFTCSVKYHDNKSTGEGGTTRVSRPMSSVISDIVDIVPKMVDSDRAMNIQYPQFPEEDSFRSLGAQSTHIVRSDEI